MSESVAAQIAKVNANIDAIIERKKKALIALSIFYAAKALQKFRVEQRSGEFWNNQTYIAMNTVFSGTINTTYEVGFFLSHLVVYGVYLELANNRQNEALRPTVESLREEFLERVVKIMGIKV